MTLQFYLAYVIACVVIVIVPGPTVTLIFANSLSHGARAGLLNIVGTQLGLAAMIGIVILGLAWIIETAGYWFDWLRFLGAAYLVWLGIKLIRSPGGLADPGQVRRPTGGFVLQGFLVLMANPKALLLFGAFIPQFVDPAGAYVGQVLLLGVTAMATAATFDTAYAVIASGARGVLSGRRIRVLSQVSGGFLIAGGAWLALTRAR